MSAWKKELEDRIAELFERKNATDKVAKKQERLTAQLERKVGRDVNRNRLKSRKTKITEEDELIMKGLDEIYTKWPFYG